MKQIYMILTTLMLVLTAQNAHADLLAETCDVQNQMNGRASAYLEVMQFESTTTWALPMGLTCDQVKRVDEYKQIIDLTIAPYVAILATPMVKESFAAELAALGIAPAAGAVLAVTIVGGTGIIVVKILMKNAMDECARQDREALKQELLTELSQKFGATSGPSVPLNVNN